MTIVMKPANEIIRNHNLERGGKVHKFFTNTCYNYMDKYVPKDIGNLRTIVDIQPDSITYEQQYARYQYYGEREDGSHKVRHYTTPGTGPYWDERMISADGEQVIKEVEDYIRRN
jgi:hypothetical protein